MPSDVAIRKAKPPPEYPPEEGSYLRGNDYSPVAVVVLLHTFYEKIPSFLQDLVRVSIEAGAALAGYLQTENVGVEKIICNIVANPNIRYLLMCGVESEGHTPGQTLRALMQNGVDEKRRIIGAEAPTPYLYNIPLEAIERFRKQVTLIDLVQEDDPILARRPEVVKEVIRCCYQEAPTRFMRWSLYDPGAYPEPPMCFKITWRIEKPWTVRSPEEETYLKSIFEAAEAERLRQTRRAEDERLMRLLLPRGPAADTESKSR
ncbi:MAG: tetrahydromethanopterin S-methyltransferase subunit A [Candidatus Bathyarchaeia archaeon]